ncbi:hypothetical protein [Streptomyces sp. NPDC101145]|uniref:hypothetical protein n=1 Tax=Streptomyces sp. NPDC101145 TaxID=3366112 RepID=UPI0038040890
MTPPRTRARLHAVAQQLAAPPPAPLDGQTAIPLVWRQGSLWDVPAPAAPVRAVRARRRHFFDVPVRPATRPCASYTRGRRITDLRITGPYL